VLSGFVSKEDHGERANTFVQDDTEGQIQTQLQSDHQASGLSLGFIARIMRGVGRKDKRGEGFELRTDAHGVVRAGNGMLLTTERRPNAQAHHKDMAETVQRLAGAQAQQETLAEMAQEVEAQDAGDQAEVAKALKAQNDDIQGSGSANPEAGTFPELAAPHLVLASPAGIEATAAQSLHIASGQHVAVSSTGHISLSSGKRLIASISRGVRIFVQNMGWRLVAAGGDIDLRALRDSINLLAKLDVTATANRITLRPRKSWSSWAAAAAPRGTAAALRTKRGRPTRSTRPRSISLQGRRRPRNSRSRPNSARAMSMWPVSTPAMPR
jgi:type VI secretion system secreted protein VgrG